MKESRLRRPLFILSAFLITTSAIFIIIASPFALNGLGRFKANWAQLSNIGQTYGAISALLAAIGLTGLVATIRLQVRESRISRADAIRSRHFELIRTVLDDPVLAETSYGAMKFSSIERRRQGIYINLLLRFWLMLWELDTLPEGRLRSYVSDMLKTESGKEYWENFHVGSNGDGSKKEKRFYRIIDEEYRLLATFYQGHYTDRPDETRKLIDNPVILSTLIGLVVGTALGRSIVLRPSRRRRPL
jgi:hypothetical protein